MRRCSYRDDPAVPTFDDTAPVAFMDGERALCAFGARMIAPPSLRARLMT